MARGPWALCIPVNEWGAYLLVAPFTWGNPSHLPIKHQSVATLIKDTTWVFPGRAAESSERSVCCLLAAVQAWPHSVTCSHL